MRLSKAFDMTVAYTGQINTIKVDKDGYISLNDMIAFFPNKTMDNWLTTKQTKEFIVVLERFLKPCESTELKIDDFGSRGAVPKGLLSIKTKSGRYGGGTYAHETLALKFAMWLSPEFELNVLLAYQHGTQTKSDWNIKRELASMNHKMMSDSINCLGDSTKYTYMNNNTLLNNIVFGKHYTDIRNDATIQQLEQISYLESKNSAYIDLGIDYETRKKILTDLYTKKYKTVQCIEAIND